MDRHLVAIVRNFRIVSVSVSVLVSVSISVSVSVPVLVPWEPRPLYRHAHRMAVCCVCAKDEAAYKCPQCISP